MTLCCAGEDQQGTGAILFKPVSLWTSKPKNGVPPTKQGFCNWA